MVLQVCDNLLMRGPVTPVNSDPERNERVRRWLNQVAPRNLSCDKFGIRLFGTKHRAGVWRKSLAQLVDFDRRENLRRRVAGLPAVSVNEKTASVFR